MPLIIKVAESPTNGRGRGGASPGKMADSAETEPSAKRKKHRSGGLERGSSVKLASTGTSGTPERANSMKMPRSNPITQHGRQVNSQYAAALEGSLAPKSFANHSLKRDRGRAVRKEAPKVAPELEPEWVPPTPPAREKRACFFCREPKLTLKHGVWVKEQNMLCGLAWWRSCFCKEKEVDPRLQQKKDGAVMLRVARQACSYTPVICQHLWTCTVRERAAPASPTVATSIPCPRRLLHLLTPALALALPVPVSPDGSGRLVHAARRRPVLLLLDMFHTQAFCFTQGSSWCSRPRA